MNEDIKKIRRNAIISAAFGILFVIVLFAMPILVLFPPRVPPDIATAERFFEKNKADIQIITDFIITEEYEWISIREADGMMKADFQEMEIPDAEVAKAVKRLFSARSDMQIYKHDNTIELQFWSHPQEIGSYIAYSIIHNELPADLPDVQFATEIIPMSADGWYYVISDYNLWRVSPH